MKTTKISEKSLAKRYNYIIPTEPPPWSKWKRGDVHDIEYDGHKFKAARQSYTLYLGTEKMTLTPWYQNGFASHDIDDGTVRFTGDSNSCAYKRIRPEARNEQEVAAFAWVLHHSKITRGTVCYVTQKDGYVKGILSALRRRGFRCVSVNRSNHKGAYPVYLLVHPGDAILKQQTTRKIDLDDTDPANHSG